MAKEYDYLLKVLLVGDSDVGKTEILSNLDEDPQNEEGFDKNNEISCNSPITLPFSATYKTTIILLDGKRVKLQVRRPFRDSFISTTQFAKISHLFS